MQQNSESYTVLARRFRPQTFAEVVGQSHVAQALRNAIRNDRIAHAYLFTGARGVGKTSMARILAKALNCPHTTDGIPCNACEICEGVTSGGDVDIQEIDGASHTGVDDVRSLRANVSVRSLRTRYKMYIIDEVHMLSKAAFNALLKTLEEPPPNVVFVFCTTEPNKLPDTVLSRCQRFDFSSIETQQIAERLAEIAQAEGYQVQPDALELVARRAAGSMRDSQSLFDQVLAFGDQQISAADVHRLLGTASDERLIELVQAITDRRRSDVLQQFDDAMTAGIQTGELFDQLLSYFRDLMVMATGSDSVRLMGVSESHRSQLADQAAVWKLTGTLMALEVLAEARLRLRQFAFTRVIAELALIRLSSLEDLQRLDQVIETLNQPAPAKRPTGPSTSSSSQSPSPPDRGRPADGSGAVHQTAHGEAHSSPPAADRRSDPSSAPISIPDPPTASGPDLGQDSQQPGESGQKPPEMRVGEASGSAELVSSSRPASGSAAPVDETPGTAGELQADRGASVSEVAVEQSQKKTAIPDEKQSESVTESRFVTERTPLEVGNEDLIISQLIDMNKDVVQKHLQAVSQLAILGPKRLVLVFPVSYTFSKQYCERSEVQLELRRQLGQIVGEPIELSLAIDESTQTATTDLEQSGNRQQEAKSPEDDPFVQQAIDLFGARLVRVEPSRRGRVDSD